MDEMEKNENNKRWNVVSASLVVLAILVIGQGILLFRMHRDHQTALKHERVQNAVQQTERRYSPSAYFPVQRRMAHEDLFHDPFQELELMSRQMNRMMSHFLGSSVSLDSDFSPSADLQDGGDSWIVKFDVPGLEKDKIQVEVQNGMLSVRGERKSEEKSEDESKGFYSREIRYGSFARTIPLPADADEGKVEASYDKGVLVVKIGKKTGEEANVHKVQIN